jgi:hypothetical protein
MLAANDFYFKSPDFARSWRGLEISIAETPPTDAPKNLLHPLSSATLFIPSCRPHMSFLIGLHLKINFLVLDR